MQHNQFSLFLTRQHGRNWKYLIGAIVLATGYQHLSQLWIERKLGHNGTEIRQIAVVVEGGQIVEQLQGAHQSLGRRRVHEIKVHQVINAQFLKLQHHSA